MTLSALVRLLHTMNWSAMPDGPGMRYACEMAILERLQAHV